MNLLVLVAGVVVLAGVVVDILWTTLWVDGGAGPLSARMMEDVWRGLRARCSDRSTVLSLAGPLLVVLTLVTWIGLLWVGWTLVFTGGGTPLIDTHDSGAITWSDRLYFVAYAIFTLGIGDIIPEEGPWQIVTVLTTASGMLFVTMSVSYVLSVIGAVSRKRSFASSVTAVGTDPELFVLTGWNGENFDGFDLTLNTLAQEIDYLAYQYKAYPILHYYHTRENKHASAVGIAVFDEALTLLRCAVPEDHRMNQAIIDNAQSSTQNYLETRKNVFVGPADTTPPTPDLERLRDAGVPVVSDQQFEAALEETADRRRDLLAMVRADAREWPT